MLTIWWLRLFCDVHGDGEGLWWDAVVETLLLNGMNLSNYAIATLFFIEFFELLEIGSQMWCNIQAGAPNGILLCFK